MSYRYGKRSAESYICTWCKQEKPRDDFEPAEIRAIATTSNWKIQCAECSKKVRAAELRREKAIQKLLETAKLPPSSFQSQIRILAVEGDHEYLNRHFDPDGICHFDDIDTTGKATHLSGTYTVSPDNKAVVCLMYPIPSGDDIAEAAAHPLGKDPAPITMTFPLMEDGTVDCAASKNPKATTKTLFLDTVDSLRRRVKPPPPSFKPQKRAAWSYPAAWVESDLSAEFRPSGKFNFFTSKTMVRDAPPSIQSFAGTYTVSVDGKTVTVKYVDIGDPNSRAGAESSVATTKVFPVDEKTGEVRCFFDGDETPGEHCFHDEPYQYKTGWF